MYKFEQTVFWSGFQQRISSTKAKGVSYFREKTHDNKKYQSRKHCCQKYVQKVYEDVILCFALPSILKMEKRENILVHTLTSKNITTQKNQPCQ